MYGVPFSHSLIFPAGFPLSGRRGGLVLSRRIQFHPSTLPRYKGFSSEGLRCGCGRGRTRHTQVIKSRTHPRLFFGVSPSTQASAKSVHRASTGVCRGGLSQDRLSYTGQCQAAKVVGHQRRIDIFMQGYQANECHVGPPYLQCKTGGN